MDVAADGAGAHGAPAADWRQLVLLQRSEGGGEGSAAHVTVRTEKLTWAAAGLCLVTKGS